MYVYRCVFSHNTSVFSVCWYSLNRKWTAQLYFPNIRVRNIKTCSIHFLQCTTGRKRKQLYCKIKRGRVALDRLGRACCKCLTTFQVGNKSRIYIFLPQKIRFLEFETAQIPAARLGYMIFSN